MINALGALSPFQLSSVVAAIRKVIWTPDDLYKSSEQGAWYDPSDLATLFSDSAGTTPAVVGQPVGLMLDKRLGSVLGPDLVTTAGPFPLAGAVAQVVGPSVVAGKTYYVSFTVSSYSGTGDVGFNGAIFPSSASTRLSGNGVISGVATATSTNTLSMFTRATNGATFSAISVRELPGNHATQPTAINRPVLQIDGNGKYYLAFNGTNQWMSTAAIDFTATDKMTVVAGVRKLSDAALGAVTELSTSSANPGSFYIIMPLNAGAASVGMSAGGTTRVAIARTGLAAPLSLVATLRADIGAPLLSAGVNGSPTTSVSPLGTGNFGNYPLYIGARAGSSLYFNGNLYGLIIRGAQSSDSQIASAERFMATKTGVALV